MRVHQSGVGLHPLILPLCCLCAGKLRPDLFEDTSLGPLHDGLCKGQVGRGRLPWRGRADRLAPLAWACCSASPGNLCYSPLWSPHVLQLQEQVGAFLRAQAAAAAESSDGSMSEGEVAELPAVDHAAGFERYKVRAACLQPCKLSCNPQEFAGTEASPLGQSSSCMPAHITWHCPLPCCVQGVDTDSYAHEAGFDAYMTGAVGIG